jgi:hypothetical protein
MPKNPNGNRNGLVEALRKRGVPDDLLKEVEAGVMRHADYTQKTQELAKVQAQVAFLMGQQSAQQRGPGEGTDPVEQYFSQFDSEEHGPVVKLLTEAFKAFEQRLEKKLGPQLQQLQLGASRMNWSQEVDAAFAEEVVPRYGKRALEKLAAVKQEAIERASKGIPVKPAALFVELFADDAMAMRQAKTAQERKTRDAQHMEGFTEPKSGSEYPPLDVEDEGGEEKPEKKPQSTEQMANSIVANIMQKRGGGDTDGAFD